MAAFDSSTRQWNGYLDERRGERRESNASSSTNRQNLVGRPVIVNEKPIRRGGLFFIDKTPLNLHQLSPSFAQNESLASASTVSEFNSVSDSPSLNPSTFDVNKVFWPYVSPGKSNSNDVQISHLSNWTSVVKNQPQINHPQLVKEQDDSIVLGDDEEKGKSKKKNKKQPKKLDTPLKLELSSMIDALQQSKVKDTPAKITTGTVSVPPVIPLKPISEIVGGKGSLSTRNVLDASAPSVMRGKEREIPKKKKLSSLRKIIDKEKEEKRKNTDEGRPIPTIIDKQKCVQSPSVSGTLGIHNRKFREYCTHFVTEKIDQLVESLLVDLAKFQDRVYKNDPAKFKSKRRFVCGLREVKKHLLLNHLKCVIVPPNLQRIQSPGGIDDALHEIIEESKKQTIPLVFSMSRRRLASILKKKYNIGCIGILSYAGAEDKFKRLIDLVRASTDHYQQNLRQMQQKSTASADMKPGELESSDDLYISSMPDLGHDIPESPLSPNKSNQLDLSHESSIKFDDDDMETVPIYQWKELFDSEETACDTEETLSVIPVLTTTNNFSWNLEAPEFLPKL